MHRQIEGAFGSSSPRRRRRFATLPRWRRTLLWTVAALAAFITWLLVDIVNARSHLIDVRTTLQGLPTTAARYDGPALDRVVQEVALESRDARDSAEGIPVRALSAIPWIGDPMDSLRAVARTVDALAQDVLPPTAQAVNGVSGGSLVAAGRVDLGRLTAVRAPLDGASAAADRIDDDAARIKTSTWLPAVNSAGSSLRRQVRDLSSALDAARTAVGLLPNALGAQGPRTVLIVLQNNSEARATGGLVGGFVVVTADRGRIVRQRIVDDVALPPGEPIDLGTDYRDLYGTADPTRIWQNSNLSPHFPYAAQIWRSLARQRTGFTADMVIGIDPPGLAPLLGVTGPIRLGDGTQVSERDVVSLTESQVYTRFDQRRPDRKAYLGEIAGATIDRLLSGGFATPDLVRAFRTAVDSDRVGVWSARADEQVRLAAGRLGHEVPYSPAPYAAVVVNNAYGSKLDYYLLRDLRYRYGLCANGRQTARVTATLTNNVRADVAAALPPEVLGTYLPGSGRAAIGTNRVSVYLYATWGARVTGVDVDGSAVGSGSGAELGHPVTYVVVDLPPQTPVTVEFTLDEPLASSPVTFPVQALVDTPRAFVSGSRCAPRR